MKYQDRYALLLLVVLVLSSVKVFAEPSYCQLDQFQQLEVKPKSKGLNRAHVYKVGQITIAGLGVGHSDVRKVQGLAEEFSASNGKAKYCTWYFNEGSQEAEKAFHQTYVSNPNKFKTPADAAANYFEIVGPWFTDSETNFLSCAEDYGYIALGCNGMKHRGPTIFGMVLAYSGCSPKNAAHIVNSVWGLNGVKEEKRLAIIEAGYRMGKANPQASARLLAMLQNSAQ